MAAKRTVSPIIRQ
jgi:hypothetical protein